MTHDATTYRTKEQVLLDLSKALGFSAESLVENRQGKLSSGQAADLRVNLVRPAALAIVLFVLPLLLWTQLTSVKEEVSFLEAFPIFIQQLFHLGALVESVGKIGVVMRVGSLVFFAGLAALIMSRFSVHLLFDLIDHKVVTREGRVIAREEQILRQNGRDPIEKYFFDLKADRYQVNLAAYRAIEDGSVYILYLLPRSNSLVAIEPKMQSGPVSEPPSATASEKTAAGVPASGAVQEARS